MKCLINEMRYILNEFSFNKATALGVIGNLCFPYSEHIVKLALYGNDEKYWSDQTKWKDEVYNFLKQASKVGRLKRNRKLKSRFYMEDFFFGLFETLSETEENIGDMLSDFKLEGFDIPTKIGYTKIYENHKKFVSEILEIFPDNFTIDDVRNLLDKYIVGCGRNA